ncbi:MAG: hypothetical protein ABJB47_24540, partial [Actinomycetota bacterium]
METVGAAEAGRGGLPNEQVIAGSQGDLGAVGAVPAGTPPDAAGDPSGDADGTSGLLAGAAGRVRAAAAALRQRAEAAAATQHHKEPHSAAAGGPAEGLLQADEPPAPVPGPPPAEPPGVPRLLQQTAAWSWRILLVGLLIYVAFRVASTLRLVVLPCLAALLLTALLQPLTSRLRRAGLPSLAATWCTILATIALLAAVGTLAANRVSADYPMLSSDIKHTAKEIQTSLAGAPFHINSSRLQHYSNQLVHFLSQHQSLVAGTVVAVSL